MRSSQYSAADSILQVPRSSFPKAVTTVHVYQVPGTSLILNFKLSNIPLDEGDMSRSILQTQVKLRRFLSTHYQADDDVLFRSDDPYKSDDQYTGCFIAFTSWPPDQSRRFTYGMLDNALKGVWDFLIKGQRFVMSEMYVLDEVEGTVGYGYVVRDPPRPPGS